MVNTTKGSGKKRIEGNTHILAKIRTGMLEIMIRLIVLSSEALGRERIWGPGSWAEGGRDGKGGQDPAGWGVPCRPQWTWALDRAVEPSLQVWEASARICSLFKGMFCSHDKNPEAIPSRQMTTSEHTLILLLRITWQAENEFIPCSVKALVVCRVDSYFFRRITTTSCPVTLCLRAHHHPLGDPVTVFGETLPRPHPVHHASFPLRWSCPPWSAVQWRMN